MKKTEDQSDVVWWEDQVTQSLRKVLGPIPKDLAMGVVGILNQLGMEKGLPNVAKKYPKLADKLDGIKASLKKLGFDESVPDSVRRGVVRYEKEIRTILDKRKVMKDRLDKDSKDTEASVYMTLSSVRLERIRKQLDVYKKRMGESRTRAGVLLMKTRLGKVTI